MHVLVTGVNGFVGQHVARDLASAGHQVFGIGVGPPADAVAQVLSDYIDHDLSRSWPTVWTVDAVIHLAALSAVGPSFENPQRYFEANSSIVTHMGEYFLRGRTSPATLIVSTGAVYAADQDMPISEAGRTAAGSPYVISKLLNEMQAQYYAKRGLPWLIARPFNHIGPGQNAGFLLPDLLTSLLEATRSNSSALVGDLTTQRDYTDVRDVARAYRLLLQSSAPPGAIVNVCSGVGRSGHELVRHLLDALGIDDVDLEVDPDRLRPADPRRVVGNHQLITRLCGWRPTIDLSETIDDLVGTTA